MNGLIPSCVILKDNGEYIARCLLNNEKQDKIFKTEQEAQEYLKNVVQDYLKEIRNGND